MDAGEFLKLLKRKTRRDRIRELLASLPAGTAGLPEAPDADETHDDRREPAGVTTAPPITTQAVPPPSTRTTNVKKETRPAGN